MALGVNREKAPEPRKSVNVACQACSLDRHNNDDPSCKGCSSRTRKGKRGVVVVVVVEGWNFLASLHVHRSFDAQMHACGVTGSSRSSLWGVLKREGKKRERGDS